MFASFSLTNLFSSQVIRRYAHTIYALSSGRGVSGVAVVRISGPAARLALTSLAGFPCGDEKLPKARYAYFRRIVDPDSGHVIDRGLTLWFPKPQSFTGEDVVEFHVHGGSAVLKLLFNALSSLPEYRMAEPGEFMRRSFNNGKVDLGEAEAISDLLNAETEAQHALAVSQIDQSRERVELYASWRKSILEALASVEAWIDFSESDDIEDRVIATARSNMTKLAESIQKRMTDARRGQRLRDGLHMAIVGPPNAGKSSLMNALCRDDDVSIVSPLAGTTRDAIERPCDIAGYPILLVDTAGLRQATADPIEKVGVEKSRARAHAADLLVFVLDASEFQQRDIDKLKDPYWLDSTISNLLASEGNGTPLQSAPVVVVALNKVDLLAQEIAAGLPNGVAFLVPNSKRRGVVCAVSCLTRLNFDTFLAAIGDMAEHMCGNPQKEQPLISGLRQLHHLKVAADYLQSFVESTNDSCDSDAVIGAESLRLAVRELGKLTGEITTDDVLDQIFRTFCVGK